MRWKGPIVLLLCLGSFCWGQQNRRREYRDESFRPSRSEGHRGSSRDQFGDFGSPRDSYSRNENDFDYEDNNHDRSQRNSGSDRGRNYDSFDSGGRNGQNQNQDYDYEEGNGGGYNQRRQPYVRDAQRNNNRAPPRDSSITISGANHDDFADYDLGSSIDATPEGRQGIAPPRGPRGPHQQQPRPHSSNDPLRQGQPPSPGFDSFGNFENNQPPPAPFRDTQPNDFAELGPGFNKEFRDFGGREFDNRPPPFNNRGPGPRFREGSQFGRPPFGGPGRPQHLVQRGPYGNRPVQEFLGGDSEISPGMLAELEQFGLRGLIDAPPSPHRSAPRPAPRAAPAPVPVPLAAAPIQHIQHAVAGIEARQASIQAVLSSDEKKAKINSNDKSVNADKINTSDFSGNEDPAKTESSGQESNKTETSVLELNKLATNIIQILNASEVLGAAEITDAEAANPSAQPFYLTTTGLPIKDKVINATVARAEVRTTTQEPDVHEMTTIPVTLPPDYRRQAGYKKRNTFLVSKVPKRKVSPEYKFLKAYHSVYRGHVKKGGREACSMCSIEYCLNTCSRVLKDACSGVDFNFETKTCTVHSFEEACSALVPEGRTTHYVHKPCEQTDNSTTADVSNTDEIDLVETMPAPNEDLPGDSKQDDAADEEAEQEVAEDQTEVPSTAGNIKPKQGVVGPSETKADDFTFTDRK